MKNLFFFIFFSWLLISCSAATAKLEESLATADLEEIDRQLNNPLSNLWSMTLQNNTGISEGNSIAGSATSNSLLFQPFLPFKLGADEKAMLTLRPVFPMATQPEFDSADPMNSTGHKTGFGDIQLLALAGPSNSEGWIWGLGTSLKFPTASHSMLGQGKYQAGPAAMLFLIQKPWTAGVLVQHWSSFAGDDQRAETSRTDIQYICRRSIPGAMSIGLGPTATIDWEAESQNRLTLPIGLGITKTIRWNKTPIKLRLETHYSLVKPDDYGTKWNFRFQVTPVIANPFK